MAINTHGGGAKTNEVGLKFEQDTSLTNALVAAGYFISNGEVYAHRDKIALVASKNDLYKRLLEPRGIDFKKIISKKLLPDDALYVYDTNTVYIIEKKFQHKAGSVDEKLQTCAFKKLQYQRLFEKLGSNVEYLYVCNDWFKREEYADVREYINEVGCHIFFNEIPIAFLGLPKVSAEV